MSLIENYLSLLKTNNFTSDDITSKKYLLDYCIHTNTASFFLDSSNKEFISAMESHDFREGILSSKKKSLQHQNSLKSFLKLANKHDIGVCLLKGAYMSNFVYPDFSMRSMRDIDVLVHEDDFLEIVNIMLENGYCFLNSNERRLTKFNFDYAHQAPILVDRFGVAVEIHHRLKTHSEIINSDYLTKNLMKNKKKKILFGLPLSVPDDNFAFIHCCHHAISKSRLNIGPIFLIDLMQFKNRINEDVLEDAKKANCFNDVVLGTQLYNYLHGISVVNEKQVKESLEIIIYCQNMPEFLPRKKFNLLKAMKKSYFFLLSSFSFKGAIVYLNLKLKQIFTFFESYILNYSLHKKRTKFFKDFNSEGM